jgi:hypothetical protein
VILFLDFFFGGQSSDGTTYSEGSCMLVFIMEYMLLVVVFLLF